MVTLPFPPFPEVPMQAVPNALALGPDGHVYVGQLTGFPFPPGGARIYRLRIGGAPQVVLEGFTNIINLAFGSDHSLYVLQFAANGLLNGPPTSSIVRVWPNGTRTTVDAPGLFAATALTVGRDGALYVSNHGASVGTGEVVRIVPSTRRNTSARRGPSCSSWLLCYCPLPREGIALRGSFSGQFAASRANTAATAPCWMRSSCCA